MSAGRRSGVLEFAILGLLHDAPMQEMVVAEDIDYDRMPHKRTPYNLPRQEVDR